MFIRETYDKTGVDKMQVNDTIVENDETIKSDKIFTTAQRTLLKSMVFLFLMGAACSLITSAYMDLYSPGSLQAREVSDIAKTFMLFTVLSSLPLWIEKGIVIKKWVTYIDSITDEDLKRTEIYRILKPIIKHVAIICIMIIIACVFIQLFNPVSPETIDNYIRYYSRGRV